MPTLRVLLVNTLFDEQQVGGAERSVVELRDGLAALGADVRVLTARPPDAASGGEAGVVRLPMRRPYWPFTDAKRRALAKADWHVQDTFSRGAERDVRAVLEAVRPDVVHTHNLQGIGTAIWPIAKAMGIPVVHTLRDHALVCPWQRFRRGRACDRQHLECRALSLPKKADARHVDHVTGISGAVLDAHLDLGYFADATTSVVPNEAPTPPDPGRIEPREAVGFLGDLGPHKGVQALLDAYPRTQGHAMGWPLRIGGTARPAVEAPLREAAPPGVTFLGRVDADAFYSTVQVVVVPSLWHEPFGRVASEAAAWGRQVVVAHRGGLPEAVAGYPLAQVYDPDVPGDLERAIDKAVRDRPDAETMRRAAQAMRGPSPPAEGYLGIYDRLVAAEGRAGASMDEARVAARLTATERPTDPGRPADAPATRRPSKDAPAPPPWWASQHTATAWVLASLLLVLAVDVLAGPVRYLLRDAFWLLLVPKLLLAMGAAWKTALLLREGRLPAPAVLTILAAGTLVGLVALFPLQVAVGLWFWTVLAAAAVAAPALDDRMASLTRPLLALWALAVVGVGLDAFVDFPWKGQQVALAGTQFDVARPIAHWFPGLGVVERAAGFSTASYAAARHILVAGTLLLVLLPRRYAAAMWIVSGAAIVLTTSKAAFAGFTGVSILLMLLLARRSWPRNAAVGAAGAGVVGLPVLSWIAPDAFAGLAPSGWRRALLQSLQGRAAGPWRDAWELLVADPWAFVVGRGVGGIGRPQDFSPEAYSAADNLFVYAFVQLGLMGLFLVAWTVVRAWQAPRRPTQWAPLLAMAILMAGMFTNTIEDIFSSAAMGFLLGLGGPLSLRRILGPGAVPADAGRARTATAPAVHAPPTPGREGG